MRVFRLLPFVVALTCVALAVRAAPAGPAPTEADTYERLQRACGLCHLSGEGGAPRLGDTQAWAPRLAQGEDVLLRHTVEGVGNMPPLGYCQDCEAADFRALIRLLSRGAIAPGN